MIQFDEHIFQMGWFNHQLVFNLFQGVWTCEFQFLLLGGTCICTFCQGQEEEEPEKSDAERTWDMPGE